MKLMPPSAIMNSEELRLKEAFFENLRYFRDDVANQDELVDEGRPTSTKATESEDKSCQVPLLPTSSNIVGRGSTRTSKGAVITHSKIQSNLDTHKEQQSGPAMKSSTIYKNTKKRKQPDSTPKAPRCRQIFEGLHFYFVPNNDIAPARRMRIRKAVEYGAYWVRDWNNSVSHIIVDKGINYAEVLKHLKLEELPASTILVSEDYPAECISWLYMVEPTRKIFLVDGHAPTNPIRDNTSRSLHASTLINPVNQKKASQRTEHDHEVTVLNKPQCIAEQEDEDVELDLGSDKKDITKSYNDPLEEAIANTKAALHLPLDSDEDDSADEVGENRPKQKKLKRVFSGRLDWQENFQCMQPHNSFEDETTNPNQQTIEVLEKMQRYYESIKDEWRSRAYRKGIATLRKQKKIITSKEQAAALPLIGERLAAKIEEIFWTKKLRRLENTNLEPTEQALKLFLDIYGVGTSQATKWVEQGHRTLKDLLDNATLTSSQRIGIDHYEDFLTRIPRSEADQLGAIVTAALHEIDPGFQAIIGGSYRRGAKDSGDIDLLITKPNASAALLRSVVVDTLVPQLQKSGFLVAALAATNRDTGSKWQGACQLPAQPGPQPPNSKSNPNPWRRIDLLLVPASEFGAALVYFTGNDIFNRSMRLLARRKGLNLNQRGLFKDVWRNKQTNARTEGKKIAGETERGVFEMLGVPWRRPWERNI